MRSVTSRFSRFFANPLPSGAGKVNGIRAHICNAFYKFHGQSTLGAELASVLGVPYIALDTLFWNPNWIESTPEEFQAKVQQRLEESEGGWVVDGNYTSRLGELVVERRTDAICTCASVIHSHLFSSLAAFL